jgi:hypothetical protein
MLQHGPQVQFAKIAVLHPLLEMWSQLSAMIVPTNMQVNLLTFDRNRQKVD